MMTEIYLPLYARHLYKVRGKDHLINICGKNKYPHCSLSLLAFLTFFLWHQDLGLPTLQSCSVLATSSCRRLKTVVIKENLNQSERWEEKLYILP
jgi:hypothetical protein